MNVLGWKKIHNWLGLGSALFLTLLLVTGVMLNHPSLLEKDTAQCLAADPARPGHLYMGRKDGLFQSYDAGGTWDEVPMLFPPQNVADVAFSPGHPERVYVLERWGRAFASRDGGRVWGALELPFDAQASGVELMKLSPGAEDSLFLLTSHGWLGSLDGGKTWDGAHFNPKARPLLRTVLTLHNGYFFGPSFVWVYDAAAAALLILIVTGFILWKTGRKIV